MPGRPESQLRFPEATSRHLTPIPASAFFPWPAVQQCLLHGENGTRLQRCCLFWQVCLQLSLVTPFDVIKTRLQVAARAGQTTYERSDRLLWKITKRKASFVWKKFWRYGNNWLLLNLWYQANCKNLNPVWPASCSPPKLVCFGPPTVWCDFLDL